MLIKGLAQVLPVRTRYKPDWNGLGSLVARYERRMHLYALRMREMTDRRSISAFGLDINDCRRKRDLPSTRVSRTTPRPCDKLVRFAHVSDRRQPRPFHG